MLNPLDAAVRVDVEGGGVGHVGAVQLEAGEGGEHWGASE